MRASANNITRQSHQQRSFEEQLIITVSSYVHPASKICCLSLLTAYPERLKKSIRLNNKSTHKILGASRSSMSRLVSSVSTSLNLCTNASLEAIVLLRSPWVLHESSNYYPSKIQENEPGMTKQKLHSNACAAHDANFGSEWGVAKSTPCSCWLRF